MSKVVQACWITLGSVCLALGTVGVFIPILPTVPFYLVTVFCYAKGSKRLHKWFLGTSLYKKHLESFVQHKTMTLRTRLTIMGSVTALMAVGFILMKNVPVGRIILAVVWAMHIVYFTFFVKSAPADEQDEATEG